MHNDPERTTPVGMIRYADDYFQAALAVDDKLGHHHHIAPIPALYLLGHALELCLKAFLLAKGIPLRDVRDSKKYGHKLHSAMRKAKELGLGQLVELQPEEDAAFELLDDLYSTKQLEYIVTGSKHFPLFGLVKSACKKLLAAVGPAVGYNF